jgi:hypothetical protein
VTNEQVREFIKKYVVVDPAFVDDLFGLSDLHSTPNDFTVDLNAAAKWLRTRKDFLKRTLVRTYTKGVDYSVEKPFSGKGVGTGVANREVVRLTPDCFKAMCMMSHAAKAKEVRAYYISAEKALLRYKDAIVESMDARIKELERNQKSAEKTRRRGVIYVIRASKTMTSLYKIGRTVSEHHRMRSHNRALADDLEVVVVYETHCVEAVEACMKRMLRPLQYRKRKEVYEVDLAVLKKVLTSCNSACTAVHRAKGTKTATTASKHDGGYYAVVLPD